jgi:hypothetical protein
VSYSGGDGLNGRVGGTALRYDSQARLGDGVRGFVFDLGACRYQSLKCLGRGSGYGGGEPARASSEEETRLRG